MRRNLPFIAAFALALLVVLAMSMFTVDQRRFAIVFQLGEIKDVITEPGLNFKWPLIQNVRTFDKRILTYDAAEPERFITSEKKPVLVDAFVKWRSIDVSGSMQPAAAAGALSKGNGMYINPKNHQSARDFLVAWVSHL